MQPPNQTTSRVQQSSTLIHATNTAKTRPAAPKLTVNASSIGRSLLFAKPGLQSVATCCKDSTEWDYDVLWYLSVECVYYFGCLFTIGLICICRLLLSNKVKMIFLFVCVHWWPKLNHDTTCWVFTTLLLWRNLSDGVQCNALLKTIQVCVFKAEKTLINTSKNQSCRCLINQWCMSAISKK